jgi:hypothetical protein
MPEQSSIHSTSRLFSELANILSHRYLAPSAEEISSALAESLKQLEGAVKPFELMMLQCVLHELTNQVDGLLAEFRPSSADVPSLDMLRRAQREDEHGEKAMTAVMLRRKRTMSTSESIRRGNELIAQGRQRALQTTAESIANGELISSVELQEALGVQRQAISGAVKSERLFAIVGPSGENFYPAYFADPTLDRRSLEQVSKVLGSLPAASKHDFFTSKSMTLQETPLDALRRGRKAEVLAVAERFVDR